MLILADPRRILLLICGVCYPLVSIACITCDLHVQVGSSLGLAALVVTFVLCVSAYCHWRNMRRLACIAEIIGAILFLTPAILIATYTAMRLDHPLADPTLTRWDAALGLDWPAFISFVDHFKPLALCLGAAYQTLAYQLFLIPILLVFVGKAPRAFQMVTCYALIGFVSAIWSAWFPALGTYVSYHADPRTLSNINPVFGYAFLDQFGAVRNDPNFVFTLDQAKGIVTFPSVHAGSAAIFAWAAFELPYLRYPFLVLNILMSVSAVTHANHYLVDVLAGVTIAAAAVLAVDFVGRDR